MTARNCDVDVNENAQMQEGTIENYSCELYEV